MAKPHPPRRRRTRPGGQAGAGPANAPSASLGADAAEAAEAAAEAEAAAWVDESWDRPPGKEPGWFREDALDETPEAAAAASPAAAAPTPAQADEAPGESAPITPAVIPPTIPTTTTGEAAESQPAATAAPLGGAVPAIAPDQPATGGQGSVGDVDGGGSAESVSEADETDAASSPGTIYRTVPPLPEDGAVHPRRRSPVTSILAGLLVLVVVAAGGFGIGMLLPLLIPLPAGSISAGSPVSTDGSSAAPTAGPSGTPAAATGGASPSAGASATLQPSVVPTPAATPLVYVVERGDQLGRIAQSFGVTLQAIQDANGITNPNLIVPGQELVIPSPGASPEPSASASPIPSVSSAP